MEEKQVTTGPVDIQWINDRLKLLGLTFGSDAAMLASWQERVTELGDGNTETSHCKGKL